MNNRTLNANNIARYVLGERFLDDIVEQYQVDYDKHYSMLTNLAASSIQRKPVFYIRNIPFVEPTSGTSVSMQSASLARYKQIDNELSELSRAVEDDQPAVEAGAIATAKAVIKQLSSRELAPPELTRLSNEAIVMLWAMGDTRYAVTITDGEVGYVVRRARQTIKRQSNIKVPDFNLLRIE